MSEVFLGIDVGSTTIKLVALDREGRLRHKRYRRAAGRPAQVVLELLEELFATGVEPAQVIYAATSGSGGRRLAELLGAEHLNEIVAQIRAVERLHPEARTVIEMGGQDSKFIRLEPDPASGRLVLEDFGMNDLCAAGTGSFLDQQAAKLGLAIDELARLAATAPRAARIAGRCTVFAKTDMTHLQAAGTPLPEILAGLCFAIARNYKATIGRGKRFVSPVLFQGGVAYNPGVVRAFREVLGLGEGEPIIPEHHEVMAAYGGALHALERWQQGAVRGWEFPGLGRLRFHVEAERYRPEALARLAPGGCAPRPLRRGAKRGAITLGIDVGSTTTKVVALDRDGELVAHRYLPTEGRPLEIVQRALLEVGHELGGPAAGGTPCVEGVAVTGSGRHLVAAYVGADLVVNEITAQAEAALRSVPGVDTVFEIGGQDSKYIRLRDGVVVDFEMNKACAAGTGSFLEEQAARLELDIRRDFARCAFAARRPVALGERCTVFMESDLVGHQQKGARKEELVAGLAYSIVENYLNKVVGTRPVGREVVIQGGVACNEAVVAAFRNRLGRPVRVAPWPDLSGAIGAAWLARRRHAAAGRSRFRGFDLRSRRYRSRSFVCRACPNLCEVTRVSFDGESKHHSEHRFFGARCERFEAPERRRAMAALPDALAVRERLLLGPDPPAVGPRVGIPQALFFYDFYPYFRALFSELGMTPVPSGPTGPVVLREAQERAVSDTCLPAKVMLGHVLELARRGVDLVFLPSFVSSGRSAPGRPVYLCPCIQAAPFVARSALGALRLPELVAPTLWFSRGERAVVAGLHRALRRYGVSRRRLRRAHRAGLAALAEFESTIRAEGERLLADGRERCVVLVGRSYALADPGLNARLPMLLRSLGRVPLPMDMLAVDGRALESAWSGMYWRSGRAMLAAAMRLRAERTIPAVFLTCYSCGPDTFLRHFFREAVGEAPYLELEVDEHTAEAGLVTRLEAFFDSLAMQRAGERGAIRTALEVQAGRPA